MKGSQAEDADGTSRPSQYWTEELAGFEYMLDASPLIVDKLRHHSYHLTGLRVYDYRSHKERAAQQLTDKLRALLRVGDPTLFVPEPRELGGFGFEIDGGFFTVDTLKYFEGLIALDKGAVLQPFREGDERRVVWEIGGGWGGFGFQFKQLCPNVTYVLVDLPEVFLFSATYLMTMFPDARVALYGEEPDLQDRWLDADFIFLPHTALEAMTPPRLDLTVNMVSFQEMTSAQVDEYVAHAYALECPYVYSLNREYSAYNPEIESVHSIIGRWYWPHEVEVLPVSYVGMLDSAKAKKGRRAKPKKGEKPERASGSNDYRHVIGWRRIET
jgi:putative sugar O-methyltransferase